MRRYLLAAFAALAIALVVTAQPSSSLRHFKVWDETTLAGEPCHQNYLVAKCSAAADYTRVGRRSLWLQCNTNTLYVTHIDDVDDGRLDIEFDCPLTRSDGAPSEYDYLEMVLTVRGSLSSCSVETPNLTWEPECAYYLRNERINAWSWSPPQQTPPEGGAVLASR